MHFFFFFNDTAPTEIYPLPLTTLFRSPNPRPVPPPRPKPPNPELPPPARASASGAANTARSEEHTSELQSRSDLVCRLLLEKKKKNTKASTRAKKPQHCTPPIPNACNY